MNDLMLNGSNLPAYLQQAAPSALQASMLRGEAGNRISIKGGRWRLIQDGEEVAVSADPVMPLIIVDGLPFVSRQFYGTVYEEGVASMPVCWSTDGVTPDKGVNTPVCTNCASCPNNAEGSGNKGKSRACRFLRRIAVAIPNRMDRVYVMQLPATSLFGDKTADDLPKPLNQYTTFLQSRNLDLTKVVTNFCFDIHETAPTVRFQGARLLTEEEFATSCQFMRDPATQAALALNYVSAAPVVTHAPVIPEQPQGFAPVTQAPVAPQSFAPVAQAPVAPQGFAPVAQAPVAPQGFAPIAQAPVAPQGFAPVAQAPVAEVPMGFAPVAPAPAAAKPARTKRTTAPADAAPVVVTAAQASVSAGAEANTVSGLLDKWGA
jgi:hypothetical protein